MIGLPCVCFGQLRFELRLSCSQGELIQCLVRFPANTGLLHSYSSICFTLFVPDPIVTFEPDRQRTPAMSYTETVELVEHHPHEIEHNAPAGMAIAPDKGSLPAAVALPATVTASGSDRPARVSTAMSAESGRRVFTAIEPVIITPPENKGKRSLIVSLLIFANLVQVS